MTQPTTTTVVELVNAWEILAKAGGHFFDSDTMRFWHSRTAELGYKVGNRAYLTVSVKYPSCARRYKVSVTDLTTGRTAYATTDYYNSARTASNAARRLAEEASAGNAEPIP